MRHLHFFVGRRHSLSESLLSLSAPRLESRSEVVNGWGLYESIVTLEFLSTLF
jgi:hypothetical protein